MHKEIFFDRQFRIWVGVIINLNGDQVGDCEYFGNKQRAVAWKSKLIEKSTDSGSMCEDVDPCVKNRWFISSSRATV